MKWVGKAKYLGFIYCNYKCYLALNLSKYATFNAYERYLNLCLIKKLYMKKQAI